MNNDEKPTWKIRPYQPGDEGQIVALFHRVFNHSITEAYWRWKVQSQPAPVNNVWLAVCEERIIGQYTCMPIRFWLGGQERFVMVGVDAMVDPDFRRRGMWTALVTHAHQVWAAANVAFALGLPNEQWGSRRDALGWQPLFGLKWQIRPLQPVPLLFRRLHLPITWHLSPFASAWNHFWNGRLSADPTIELVPVTQADDTIDQLWIMARDHVHFCAIRDRAWVQWRYLDAPDNVYQVLLAQQHGQPVGYVAYALRETQNGTLAVLADLFSLPQPTVNEAFLRLTIEHLTNQGVCAIAALAIPTSPWSRLLRRTGFSFSWGTFGVRAVPLDSRWSVAQLCQHDKWLLTGGEFDAV